MQMTMMHHTVLHGIMVAERKWLWKQARGQGQQYTLKAVAAQIHVHTQAGRHIMHQAIMLIPRTFRGEALAGEDSAVKHGMFTEGHGPAVGGVR